MGTLTGALQISQPQQGLLHRCNIAMLEPPFIASEDLVLLCEICRGCRDRQERSPLFSTHRARKGLRGRGKRFEERATRTTCHQSDLMVQTTAHAKQKLTPQEDALLLDAEGTQMKDRPVAESSCHRCG